MLTESVALTPMKVAAALSAWLLAAGTTWAQAHAHLEQAIPADGSVITAAPTELVLRFSESARLIVLSVARDGGSRQRIVPLPQQPQARIVVALPPLAPGHYVVSWRALSADGHVVPGQIRFTLNR
jgi:methionine-rich copper-binding protein CopC